MQAFIEGWDAYMKVDAGHPTVMKIVPHICYSDMTTTHNTHTTDKMGKQLKIDKKAHPKEVSKQDRKLT